MSDLIELCGFGALAEGVNVLLGRGAAFVAVGIILLFVGSAVDDKQIAASVRKAARSPFAGYSRAKQRFSARKARRESGSRLPAVRA